MLQAAHQVEPASSRTMLCAQEQFGALGCVLLWAAAQPARTSLLCMSSWQACQVLAGVSSHKTGVAPPLKEQATQVRACGLSRKQPGQTLRKKLMKRSWLVETMTLLRSHMGVTANPCSASRVPLQRWQQQWEPRTHLTSRQPAELRTAWAVRQTPFCFDEQSSCTPCAQLAGSHMLKSASCLPDSVSARHIFHAQHRLAFHNCDPAWRS